MFRSGGDVSLWYETPLITEPFPEVFFAAPRTFGRA